MVDSGTQILGGAQPAWHYRASDNKEATVNLPLKPGFKHSLNEFILELNGSNVEIYVDQIFLLHIYKNSRLNVTPIYIYISM